MSSRWPRGLRKRRRIQRRRRRCRAPMGCSATFKRPRPPGRPPPPLERNRSAWTRSGGAQRERPNCARSSLRNWTRFARPPPRSYFVPLPGRAAAPYGVRTALYGAVRCRTPPYEFIRRLVPSPVRVSYGSYTWPAPCATYGSSPLCWQLPMKTKFIHRARLILYILSLHMPYPPSYKFCVSFSCPALVRYCAIQLIEGAATGPRG
jgi:hypothetical protein